MYLSLKLTYDAGFRIDLLLHHRMQPVASGSATTAFRIPHERFHHVDCSYPDGTVRDS